MGQIPVSLPFPCDLWVKGKNGQQVGAIGQLREANEFWLHSKTPGDGKRLDILQGGVCTNRKRPCLWNEAERKGWLN